MYGCRGMLRWSLTWGCFSGCQVAKEWVRLYAPTNTLCIGFSQNLKKRVLVFPTGTYAGEDTHTLILRVRKETRKNVSQLCL